jgi:hypothetical protein
VKRVDLLALGAMELRENISQGNLIPSEGFPGPKDQNFGQGSNLHPHHCNGDKKKNLDHDWERHSLVHNVDH